MECARGTAQRVIQSTRQVSRLVWAATTTKITGTVAGIVVGRIGSSGQPSTIALKIVMPRVSIASQTQLMQEQQMHNARMVKVCLYAN